ncbi:flagellar motor protein MotB [Aeromonas veronii]|uniref:OmpA/MotB family protein n=1 Tax=Aeromonas caviae TaxID=648 RepID=UPI002B49542D|nr:OmpA family protein [Aeromonas caviae]
MNTGYSAFQKAKSRNSDHWISMSDLMAGLMMVFLFISVAYMHYVRIERDKIKQVAIAYQSTQAALYDALFKEFHKDLPSWDAEIDRQTLEFRFKSPDSLFKIGSTGLNSQFQSMLSDFFPRYLEVLGKFRVHITEIRIEGHTSSGWSGAATPDIAYFNNMELSQGRTHAVLQYLYKMPTVTKDRSWIKKVFSAVGYSSAHPILDSNGNEDSDRSRRVTFKVLTNAEIQIRKILQE